ncbi:pyridoxal-phosphate dependent enzyme [Caminibacter mediatlanticus]|uniref:Cysteine synthase n=1 Tax=Caminibacter mediatlanticus TB-2 TaxID=391592 RepID=A0AAI9AH75_9BACT|nr:pyridoxal-phosphate dependent enzyme [Caminibacter mediatlanticus]EDM23452.1 cysteine synthase [Caminibacter mediatlanticus TB-2]
MFNTPLYNLGNISIKLEYKNPAGSIKDRPALFIIKDAFLKGYKEVVEVTSGNTGIALSFYAQKFNIKATIFMPKTFSIERQKLLRAYGANLILTDGTIKDALQEAKEYIKKHNAYYSNQFENLLNSKAQEITALEIINQTQKIDYFVSGVGSGGSISGIAKILKPIGVKIITVESKNAPLIYNQLHNKNLPIHPHKIQGIGAGFIPKILDINLIDDVILIDDDEAIEFMKKMPKLGITGGISTAANILASKKLQGNIVTLAPDGIEKYLSIF